MTTTTFAALAAASDGISIRMMTLLTASTFAGVLAGCLGYMVSKGTHNQNLAAGVIAGFIAFVGAYKYLDGVVSSQPTPAAPAPSHTLGALPHLLGHYRFG
jgi:hypothetical protein